MRFFLDGMDIKVNGQPMSTGAMRVSDLLRELGITPERVAVELNLKVVSKKDYETAALAEGDEVEIVNFVGGG